MAWQPPSQDHEYALHSGLKDFVTGIRQERSMAPIDTAQRNPVQSSMSQGINTQNGFTAGPFEPGSMANTAPVGEAQQINIKVKPHLLHSTIQHSLGSMLK